MLNKTKTSNVNVIEIHAFLCPISRCEMEDPVIAEDNQTYDRASIEEWFEKHDTSPLTREVIGKELYPNYALREAIDNFNAANQFIDESKSKSITHGKKNESTCLSLVHVSSAKKLIEESNISFIASTSITKSDVRDYKRECIGKGIGVGVVLGFIGGALALCLLPVSLPVAALAGAGILIGTIVIGGLSGYGYGKLKAESNLYNNLDSKLKKENESLVKRNLSKDGLLLSNGTTYVEFKEKFQPTNLGFAAGIFYALIGVIPALKPILDDLKNNVDAVRKNKLKPMEQRGQVELYRSNTSRALKSLADESVPEDREVKKNAVYKNLQFLRQNKNLPLEGEAPLLIDNESATECNEDLNADFVNSEEKFELNFSLLLHFSRTAIKVTAKNLAAEDIDYKVNSAVLIEYYKADKAWSNRIANENQNNTELNHETTQK